MKVEVTAESKAMHDRCIATESIRNLDYCTCLDIDQLPCRFFSPWFITLLPFPAISLKIWSYLPDQHTKPYISIVLCI